MFQSFLSLLQEPKILSIIIVGLIVGIMVSLCSSLLGVSLVLKRFSMIGDGLSHVGYGALSVAAALKLSGEYSLEISIPIVLIAAFFILKINESGRVNSDAAVALVSTSAMAIGTIIFSLSGGTAADACNSLFGSASLITLTEKDLILSIVISLVTVSLFVVFYNRIFAITFDEDFSKATGIKADLYNLLIALLTAVTIVIGMRLMGAVLISGLIIFPPLSAMKICKSFKSVVVTSAIISVICFCVGFMAACVLNLQTGPVVICTNLLMFIILNIINFFRNLKTAK